MASGDTLAVLTPLHHEPPASNPADFTVRNQHTLLAFDDTTSESAVFKWLVPRHYGGSGITVYIHWSAPTSAGDVDWDIAAERIGEGITDIDSDNFGTATSIDGNAPAGTVGDVTIDSGAISHSNCGSPSVGDAMRLKIIRDVADEMSGDAQLYIIEIKET